MDNSIWNNTYINFENLRTSDITNDDISERYSYLSDIITMANRFIIRQFNLDNSFHESDKHIRIEKLIEEMEKESNTLNKVEYKLKNNLVTPGLEKEKK
mgnify:CR=1 FL=1